jgi:hypothetical protein
VARGSVRAQDLVVMAKRLCVPAALLLPLACSGGVSSVDGDDALIVPEGLGVTALAGGNGVLELIALTLRKGPGNTELYAALRNGGTIPACSAAFSFELFDKTERSVAAGIGGLLTQHFYRLRDGSDTIAACVGPGDVSMVAVTDLPSDLVIEELGSIVYRCPYFALDVAPIEGLRIGKVERVSADASTAYTGTLVNGLDVTLRNPSVTIFPVNRGGRPLGVASSSGSIAIPPGGSWTFETDSVALPGMDCVAYPAGELVR